ncbi:hypothetical protein BDV96DRAFT_682091 [Lophiotrema nucula]|uniref:BTB domain-containing protein n=1 Tax=Lophiotrema nucula TaxID=690887 RepID=A0A6A5ZT83_9PLEO|nr:hypothetical protein BDV96DRAFT_682091 [Lophiotrema nucula]
MAPLRDIHVPKSSYTEFIHSSMVKIIVGKEEKQQSFTVYENIITSRSAFFCAALNGKWVESQDKIVKLPDEDPESAALYLQLIMTNKLGIRDISKLEMMKMFIDVESKNLVIHGMLARCRDSHPGNKFYVPGSDIVRIIYAGTASKSDVARKLLIDMYAQYGSPDWFKDANSLEKYPPEFVMDVMMRLIETRDREVGEEEKVRFCDPEKYMEKKEEPLDVEVTGENTV